MHLVIGEIEDVFSNGQGISRLLSVLVSSSHIPRDPSTDGSLSLRDFVELAEDLIALWIAILDLTTDDGTEYILPFLMISIVMWGPSQQSHIVDYVGCSQVVQGAQTRFDHLCAQRETDQRHGLGTERVTED